MGWKRPFFFRVKSSLDFFPPVLGVTSPGVAPTHCLLPSWLCWLGTSRSFTSTWALADFFFGFELRRTRAFHSSRPFGKKKKNFWRLSRNVFLVRESSFRMRVQFNLYLLFVHVTPWQWTQQLQKSLYCCLSRPPLTFASLQDKPFKNYQTSFSVRVKRMPVKFIATGVPRPSTYSPELLLLLFIREPYKNSNLTFALHRSTGRTQYCYIVVGPGTSSSLTVYPMKKIK